MFRGKIIDVNDVKTDLKTMYVKSILFYLLHGKEMNNYHIFPMKQLTAKKSAKLLISFGTDFHALSHGAIPFVPNNKIHQIRDLQFKAF